MATSKSLKSVMRNAAVSSERKTAASKKNIQADVEMNVAGAWPKM